MEPPAIFWNYTFSFKENALFDIRRVLNKDNFVILLKKPGVQTSIVPLVTGAPLLKFVNAPYS